MDIPKTEPKQRNRSENNRYFEELQKRIKNPETVKKKAKKVVKKDFITFIPSPLSITKNDKFSEAEGGLKPDSKLKMRL